MQMHISISNLYFHCDVEGIYICGKKSSSSEVVCKSFLVTSFLYVTHQVWQGVRQPQHQLRVKRVAGYWVSRDSQRSDNLHWLYFSLQLHNAFHRLLPTILCTQCPAWLQ